MGRHDQGCDPLAGGPEPSRVDARGQGLPGWGAFATAVAAGFVGWAHPRWSAVAGVVTLGMSTTAGLWWAARPAPTVPRQARGSRVE